MGSYKRYAATINKV